jgi:hypothetical protein
MTPFTFLVHLTLIVKTIFQTHSENCIRNRDQNIFNILELLVLLPDQADRKA